MRLTYDPSANIAYIHQRGKKGKVQTVSVGDELNVDLAADGTIYGIELLNANDKLAGENAFIVENRAAKDSSKTHARGVSDASLFAILPLNIRRL